MTVGELKKELARFTDDEEIVVEMRVESPRYSGALEGVKIVSVDYHTPLIVTERTERG